jgi:unsaturated chondroitin disaccharide hydrolase
LNPDHDVDGVLLHSCYSVPHGRGIGGATAWGDFYYGLALAVAHGIVPIKRLLGSVDGAGASPAP